jgi:glycosyltransferase involved in cell wall biosynthesis
MARTPAIVSIDSTSRLASLEAPSAAGRWSYKPNIVHDGIVFRAARAIVSTSEWARRDLADLYPECAAKVHVIPYPVRDSFDAEWIAERHAHARRDPSAPVRVLFVGGDFPRKGGADLLDAWRAGAFAGRASLDLVTDWPIPSDATPPGVRVVRGTAPYTAAWFELWRRADIFVMPTRHEAFGIVYEEAAAAGLPAIGTAINAVPEIIEADTTGLLVPAGDVAALVGALRALIDSADLRRRLGSAARARVRQRAFPDRYAAKLAPLIHRVMTADVHAA